MEPIDTPSETRSTEWRFLGARVPKSEIVFFTQILIIYTVIVVSLYNLTRHPDNDTSLWTALLSSSIGYLLPNPTIKKNKI